MNLLNPGFITVRTASTRLPKKCLLPFGDVSVIHHVIRRAKLSSLDPILCTTTDPSDDILVSIFANDSPFTHQASKFLFDWSTTDTKNSLFSAHSSLAIVEAAQRSLQDGIPVLIQPLT